MAWHYKAYEREQAADDRHVYVAAENAARTATKGLVGHTQPDPTVGVQAVLWLALKRASGRRRLQLQAYCTSLLGAPAVIVSFV